MEEISRLDRVKDSRTMIARNHLADLGAGGGQNAGGGMEGVGMRRMCRWTKSVAFNPVLVKLVSQTSVTN